jgi:hypothetical protein
MRAFLSTLIVCGLVTGPLAAGLSPEETALIEHVQESIEKAEKGESGLGTHGMQISGALSDKVRHFVNNLCARADTRVLEVGLWEGARLVSALYENSATTVGVGVDNWSEHPEAACIENCTEMLHPDSYSIVSADCFAVNPATYISKPINVYLYDADASQTGQKAAFTHFNGVLSDLFVAVIDDWNWESVRKGTAEAFQELNYQVLYEVALPARFNCDLEQWWNGLYVAVVRKPPAKS